jgi:uncharacterized DUF497 family protein
MKVEWDRNKAAANLAKHRVAFDAVRDFTFEVALIWEDDRRDYGEPRMVALGFIGSRLHHLCYTVRGDALRIISLRKANEREIKRYEQNI